MKQLVFAYTDAFFAAWALMLVLNLTVRQPLTLFLFLCLLFFRRRYVAQKTGGAALYAGAALYTLSTVLAVYERCTAHFESALFRLLTAGILLYGLFRFHLCLLRLLTEKGLVQRTAKLFLSERGAAKSPAAEFFDRHILALSFAACFLSYLPWFLYSYPGILSPDPVNQFMQVLHLAPYSNHHPVAHTLLMGLCYRIGRLFTADVNAAFSCYTLFQMLFLSLAAACAVHLLRRLLHMRLALCLAALAFYALSPFMAVQSVAAGKDTVFAAALLIFSCSVADAALRGIRTGDGKRDACRAALFVFSALAAGLFRTNGRVVLLIFAPFFLSAFPRQRGAAAARIVPVLLAVFILSGPVVNALRIAQPDTVESLHIPMQQMARVMAKGRDIPEEERALLNEVMETEHVPALYNPFLADNIKELVRAGHPEVLEKNLPAYGSLWLKWLFRYPADYVLAFGDMVRGFVYPDMDYEVAEIEGIIDNPCGLYARPLIRGAVPVKLRELVIRLGSFVPLYGLLWSIGSYSRLLLLSFLLIITQGRRKQPEDGGERGAANGGVFPSLLPLIPYAALLFTYFLATPISGEFRYGFPLVLAAPLFLCLPFTAVNRAP